VLTEPPQADSPVGNTLDLLRYTWLTATGGGKHGIVFLVAFGIVGAVAQGLVGVGTAWVLQLDRGDALLLAILFGSASYIAVPAALRLVLPKANPSLYIPLSLAVTFPFNIIVGIPLYHLLIGALGIGAGGS